MKRENPASSPAVATTTSAIDELATYDPRYVEIDACPNIFLGDTPGCIAPGTSTPVWQGDANIYAPAPNGDDQDLLVKLGNQTTSGTNRQPSQSYSFPGPADGTYIDWNDLASGNARANHVRTDPVAAADTSGFPQADSCVDSANVLGKMDITAVTVSNNTQYAYFGVQRRENTGDAGYMWLFTKNVPLQAPNAACPSPKYELRYQLRTGDVMFRGHFVPDTTERLLYVYRIVGNLPASVTVGNIGTFNKVCPNTPVVEANCYIEMPAKAAINWENGLWTENAAYVAAAATNSSPAGVGALGFNGSTATVASGDTFVIHNSNPVPDYTWRCDDAAGCMQPYIFAEVAVPISVFTAGSLCNATFYGSVITRPSGNTATPDMKDLAGPYQFNFGQASITASAAGSCSNSFTYKIDSFTGIGGAISPTNCAWKITGPNFSNVTFDSDCSSYTAQDTYSSASLSGTYNLSVTADDGQGCSATTAVGPITIYDPLAVQIEVASTVQACTPQNPNGANMTDAASFAPKSGYPSGGSGTYTYHWYTTSALTTDALCSSVSSATCAHNPSDSLFCEEATFVLRVTDSSSATTGCTGVTSKAATYTKQTIIGASVAP